jgi:carbonic anhydrase/acetyltransferase-like protein (isoleucine patch superfamily)
MTGDNGVEILKPRIHNTVFVAAGACIYGDVEIGAGSSIWFNAVIRGDEGKIIVGRNTNIQDNAVLHSDLMVSVEIGDNVTIGHGAIVRGARIEDNVMVGMNSTVMTNSVIGENSIVGANSFIAYNKIYPPRSLIMGAPARLVRELREEELGAYRVSADIYRALVEGYSADRIVGYRGE